MEILQAHIDRDYSDVIRRAVEVLKAGGTVICPTDTLYGLGANALDIKAVAKIFKIKERPNSKPLPVIVRNIAWAKELAFVSPRNEKILNSVWPGAVTVVLPKNKIIPDIVTSNSQTVGLRIPNHPITDEILGRFGYPLALTSANISGDEPSVKMHEIIATFLRAKNQPDLIIDCGSLPPSDPSTVLDLTTDKPKILRVGATKPEQLMKLLEI